MFPENHFFKIYDILEKDCGIDKEVILNYVRFYTNADKIDLETVVFRFLIL